MSPSLRTSSQFSPWAADIRKTWLFITSQYRLCDDIYQPSIAIIPERPFTLPELKLFAQAYIHFGKVISRLSPSRYVKEDWCITSNWHGTRYLGGKTADEAIVAIDRIKDFSTFHRVFSRDNSQSNHRYTGVREYFFDTQNRGIFYNFIPTLKDLAARSKSDELPQLGVISELCWWVNFILSFTERALACGSSLRLRTIKPNFEGFRSFMGGGRPNPVGTSFKLPELPAKA